MHHVATARPLSAAATKAAAVLAYDAACADPAAADWRAVADLLRAALPATRKSLSIDVESDAATGPVPRWWADWKLGKVYSLDTLEVTFADGQRVRCNIAQAPRKLPRIAAACRVAIAFYRARTGADVVPAFAHIENVSDGSDFDAEACSRLTADLRAFLAPVEPWTPGPCPSTQGPEGETDVERAARIHGGRWRVASDGRVVRVYDAPTFAPVVWEFPTEAEQRAALSADANPPPSAGEGGTEAVIGLSIPEQDQRVDVVAEAPALISAATIVSPDLNAPVRDPGKPVAPVEALAAPRAAVVASRALAARLSASATGFHIRPLR